MPTIETAGSFDICLLQAVEMGALKDSPTIGITLLDYATVVLEQHQEALPQAEIQEFDAWHGHREMRTDSGGRVLVACSV